MTTTRPTSTPALGQALALAQLLDHIETTAPVPCRDPELDNAAWISDHDAEQAVAAAVCRRTPCPALTACATYGRMHTAERGVYGGRTETERHQRTAPPDSKPRPTDHREDH